MKNLVTIVTFAVVAAAASSYGTLVFQEGAEIAETVRTIEVTRVVEVNSVEEATSGELLGQVFDNSKETLVETKDSVIETTGRAAVAVKETAIDGWETSSSYIASFFN